jgi:hypothetical protein
MSVAGEDALPRCCWDAKGVVQLKGTVGRDSRRHDEKENSGMRNNSLISSADA